MGQLFEPLYITEPFEPPPTSDFVLILMANQIDPQQLLQTIQVLGQALDTTRLAVDTHIVAQAADMARMATQITNNNTSWNSVYGHASHCPAAYHRQSK